eukprot:5216717-Pyramimonas_sp.AAC.1
MTAGFFDDLVDLCHEVSCDHQVAPGEMAGGPLPLRIYAFKIRSVRDPTDSSLAIRRSRRR